MKKTQFFILLLILYFSLTSCIDYVQSIIYKDGKYEIYVMGNLMNAAKSLGIASIWIHRAKEEFESDFGKQILKNLGIEGEWEGIGHVALGYADEGGEKPAAERKENVHWVK